MASKSLLSYVSELAKNGRKHCGIPTRKQAFEDRKQLKKSRFSEKAPTSRSF
jgi:transcriptional accessory protein Tex/SPT6